MPPTQPATRASAVASVPPPKSRIRRVATTADSAIRLPTDRSMPAVIITIVMPMAKMAITTIWSATLTRFSGLRKFGNA